jgi:hypothetical protein
MNFFRNVFHVLFLLVIYSSSAHAHLMVEQHGTLKFGKGGYYFVLSLPIRSLEGVDDDADGLLSSKEFRNHYDSIVSSVDKGFVLESLSRGQMNIEGLIINVSHSHGHTSASHVVAMGRFRIDSDLQDLLLTTTLFGVGATEQEYQITITHGSNKEKIVLSSTKPTHRLFHK